AVLGVNYPTAVAMAGDALLTLSEFNRVLSTRHINTNHNGLDRVKQAVDSKFSTFNEIASSTDKPVRPETVIKALQNALDDDAIVCADPGTPCPYFSAFYRWPKTGRHFITNRAHGALGYSLAAAIGAQVARPNATVMAAMGDGSFAFSCGEMETVMRLNLPIKMIVFSNSVFGWIKAGQHSGFGKRYHNVDFTPTDHAAVASAYGIKSWTLDNPAELQQTLQLALAHSGPTLIDIITQPLQETSAPVSEWVA
ncbi:MAG: thiamine pyrophosphate-binding protein, partial [Aestuariibacter sp.]|nr:thiamine pyrophosphate-binding protein [Aestuariibacter sp.]